MWEPFESDFDAINVRFDDRVQIVIRTAGIVEHKRLRSKELLETQQKAGEDYPQALLKKERKYPDFDIYIYQTMKGKDYWSGYRGCRG